MFEMGKQNCWKFKKYEWVKASDFLADASYSGNILSIPCVTYLNTARHDPTRVRREAGNLQGNIHPLLHEDRYIPV
jgi:hypothetical protein